MKGGRVWLAVWAIGVLAAAVIVARAHYTADLSAFLPAQPTPAQRLLVNQLRDGPASHIILAAIEGESPSERARLSSALASRLRSDARFRTVLNGDTASVRADQAYVFEHRYLLSSRVSADFFSQQRLAASIGESVDLLASPLGLMAKDLFARDPTGETLAIAAALERTDSPAISEGVWASRDGSRALLVVDLAASGSDTDGQQIALDSIDTAFAAERKKGANNPVLRLTGPAVFSVNARATIEQEAKQLSILSSLLIISFLLVIYRSPALLIVGMLPVVTGALAGVAAVALGFGVVHGVTLGFGVTLIGEAVDYSVYRFLQTSVASPTDWTLKFWPTVRLGMLTSIVGFSSLLPSSFPGLAQLGLYSMTGLVIAGLVTRFVLGAIPTPVVPVTRIEALGRICLRVATGLRAVRPLLFLVPIAAAAGLLLRGQGLWSHDLAALSPVPADQRAFDSQLRRELGAADAGKLVVVSGNSVEGALMGAERVGAALSPLIGSHAIGGFDSPARYLPSQATQKLRQQNLPSMSAASSVFKMAARDLPIHPEGFGGFLQDIETARSGPLLTLADIEGTAIGSAVRALLVQDGNRWLALLPIKAWQAAGNADDIDAAAVESALRSVSVRDGEAVLLDIGHETRVLYSGYLSESVRLSLVGLAALVVLLLAALRSVERVVRVVTPLLLAITAVVAGFAAAGHALSILNLVGLLLTAAVGSNYSLFFDRETGASDPLNAARTIASLVVANTTTVIAFGVLATSSVPVLSDVGATVAPGALLALVFSAMLARPAASVAVP